MSVKISVVIPVYNAEKYLAQCLDSVLSQSLADIEVICVDDGSSDRSAEIIAGYADRDGRVSLLRNDRNTHAGACRNRGLEASRGEYVLFMDGDDMLLPGSLEKLYTEAKRLDADVLRCRAVDYDNVTGALSHGAHNYLTRVPFFLYGVNVSFRRWYWLFPKLNAAPWGGICRRTFLTEKGIRFNDLVCVNDRSFYWETVLKAERIAFSKTELLLYRMNMSSSLVGSRIKNFDCHFGSYRLIERMLADQPEGIRRSILNGEMLDIANWAEQSRRTEYADAVAAQIADFISGMDRSPWGGSIAGEKWYVRINKGQRGSKQ